MDFNRAEPTCYRTNFFTPVPAKNEACWYIVLRVMRLTNVYSILELCPGFSDRALTLVCQNGAYVGVAYTFLS